MTPRYTIVELELRRTVFGLPDGLFLVFKYFTCRDGEVQAGENISENMPSVEGVNHWTTHLGYILLKIGLVHFYLFRLN